MGEIRVTTTEHRKKPAQKRRENNLSLALKLILGTETVSNDYKNYPIKRQRLAE